MFIAFFHSRAAWLRRNGPAGAATIFLRRISFYEQAPVNVFGGSLQLVLRGEGHRLAVDSVHGPRSSPPLGCTRAESNNHSIIGQLHHRMQTG